MTFTELQKLHECASNILDLMKTARGRIDTRTELSKMDLFPTVADHWKKQANDTRLAYKRLERSYHAIINKIQSAYNEPGN